MKIYINGRFLSQRVTGVQRYAREIVTALDKLLQEGKNEDEWCILAPKNIIDDLPIKNIKIKICGSFIGHLWEQLELPFYARNGFLVNLCNCAPLVKKNQLVTIHDAAVAAFPKAYSWRFRIWYKILFTVCGKWASKIVTVSRFSRNELNEYFDIPKDKIAVIYNGIDHIERIKEDSSIIEDLGIGNEKYVLAVSSQNLTKNFSLIFNAAKQLQKIKFVIVGGANKAVFADINSEKLINVIYTGYISDEKLVALYKYAAVFIYPSLYEGFGIPPLEAMSHGCPVVVSDCASLPEVCGDNALYCHPNDENDLIDKILEVVSRGNVPKYASRKIKEKYSWEKSARCIYDILQMNVEQKRN